MIQYDSNKPLIIIHIPKCGGTTLENIFRTWFGANFFPHYYRIAEDQKPTRHPLLAGSCIYGHFNRNREFGVEDYYPEVNQFVTFIRNPLEIATSNYFYWKRTLRPLRIKNGKLLEGDHLDYRNIQDFFEKRPRSHLLNFLPKEINEINYKLVLEEKFVYIGITEDLETSVSQLAQRLGLPEVPPSHLNKSVHDEQLPEELKHKFEKDNELEYLIYDYVKSSYNCDNP